MSGFARALPGASILAVLCVCAGSVAAQAPNPPAGQAIQRHYRQAEELLRQKRYDEAADEFRKMLRLDPKLAQAHANLGSIYYLQGNYPQASESFRRALQLKPSLARAEMFLGMSEAKRGRAQEALAHLANGFWKSAENDEWRLQAGLLLIELHHAGIDLDKAVEVTRALQRAYPSNPDVLYIAYRLYSDLGSRAVSALVKAAPESARLHQLTAELLESEGDFPRAVEQHRKALARHPALPGARRALGVAIMNSGPDEAARGEAQRLFEQELTLNRNDALAEYQLGEIYWVRNQTEEALKHFSRAVELRPNFPDALIAAGKAWTALEQLERAVELLRKAVEIDPDNEVARYRLAQAYRKMGLDQQATEQMNQFRKLRAAMESMRSIYKQVQRNPITAQSLETTNPPE